MNGGWLGRAFNWACVLPPPALSLAAAGRKAEGRRELRLLKATLARSELERQLGQPLFGSSIRCGHQLHALSVPRRFPAGKRADTHSSTATGHLLHFPPHRTTPSLSALLCAWPAVCSLLTLLQGAAVQVCGQGAGVHGCPGRRPPHRPLGALRHAGGAGEPAQPDEPPRLQWVRRAGRRAVGGCWAGGQPGQGGRLGSGTVLESSNLSTAGLTDCVALPPLQLLFGAGAASTEGWPAGGGGRRANDGAVQPVTLQRRLRRALSRG